MKAIRDRVPPQRLIPSAGPGLPRPCRRRCARPRRRRGGIGPVGGRSTRTCPAMRSGRCGRPRRPRRWPGRGGPEGDPVRICRLADGLPPPTTGVPSASPPRMPNARAMPMTGTRRRPIPGSCAPEGRGADSPSARPTGHGAVAQRSEPLSHRRSPGRSPGAHCTTTVAGSTAARMAPMTRRLFIFDDPDRFVAGTVGEPGRSVLLSSRRARGRIDQRCPEKVQVVALARRLEDLLDAVEAPSPSEAADDYPLDEPVVELFRVGAMALAWDPDGEEGCDRGTDPERDGEYVELPDDAEDGPDLLRVRIASERARLRQTRRGARVCRSPRVPVLRPATGSDRGISARATTGSSTR